jgi:hypothetical protein
MTPQEAYGWVYMLQATEMAWCLAFMVLGGLAWISNDRFTAWVAWAYALYSGAIWVTLFFRMGG